MKKVFCIILVFLFVFFHQLCFYRGIKFGAGCVNYWGYGN